MSARIALMALLVACAVIVGHAEVPATFILTNGQRHDGTVIYGRGDNNIVDSRFHLLEGGADRSFGLDEVAAIDFVGGAPTASELQALPNTSVMVMRNGTMMRGTLHNIVRDDSVQWVNEGGQRSNVPIRDVSRVYLKPAIARSAYTAAPGGAPAPAPAQAGFGSNVVRVDARQAWTNTGVTVRRGDRVIFNGTGDINVGPGLSAGVAGSPVARGFYPVPDAPGGALIGRIGNRGMFAIGSNTQPVTMSANGPLMLGINDDNLGDNNGAFTVTITRQ